MTQFKRHKGIWIGPLQYAILNIIKTHYPIYGAQIQRILAAEREDETSMTMIYRVLDILKGKEMISIALQPASITYRGRPRIFFQINDKGIKAIDDFAIAPKYLKGHKK